jgi:Zn-dependent protease
MLQLTINKVNKFLGLELKFHWSVLILILIIASSMGEMAIAKFQEINIILIYATSILTTLGVILSVIAHEMGHVIAGRKFGVQCSDITIFALGGAARPTSEFTSAKSEFFTAIGGPLVSIGIAIVLILAVILMPINLATWNIFMLGIMNVMLGVFNLIPAFPLDGGRVLRSAIWKVTGSFVTATKYASYIGQFFGGCMIGLGIYTMISTLSFNGIWFGVIGFFIIVAARHSWSEVKRKG